MREFVHRVRETATRAGAACIPYSQCLEPTATLLRTVPGSTGGICQALCAKWIAEHANDRSIWNWLCVPGTMNLRPGVVANLMINFAESLGEDRPGGAFDRGMRRGPARHGLPFKDVVTERFLAQHGVVRRGQAQARMTRLHGCGGGQALGARLGRELDPDLWPAQGCYVLVSILGPGGGHALCAHIGGQDACLFDPNFGEFYFDSRPGFKAFLRDFWTVTGYRDEFDAYYLLDFLRKVN